jgi:hypothetical protein
MDGGAHRLFVARNCQGGKSRTGVSIAGKFDVRHA